MNELDDLVGDLGTDAFDLDQPLVGVLLLALLAYQRGHVSAVRLDDPRRLVMRDDLELVLAQEIHQFGDLGERLGNGLVGGHGRW